MTQILVDPAENDRSSLHLSNNGVTATTEEPSHATTVVAMVHNQIPVGGIAEKATPSLGVGHRTDLLRGQLVLPHQSRPEVASLGSLRISATPLSQALVTARFILLRVLPSSFIGAAFAIGPKVLARLRELIQRQRLAAAGAGLCLHPFSMTCQRDIAFGLDKPCHADVLLELANGGA